MDHRTYSHQPVGPVVIPEATITEENDPKSFWFEFWFHMLASLCLQEGWIREKEQILSSEDYGKDLTGALRLLSQHKAFEDEMSGRAAHLQQTIKQGEDLVADNHFGADKIRERIRDIQVSKLASKHALILKCVHTPDFFLVFL